MLSKTILKKSSSVLAALMIVSMLVPVLAFAQAWFKDVTYSSNGSVTGQVYFSSDRVTDSVYLNVYSNGNFYSTNSVNTATYSTYSNGYYYYNFSLTVSDATYNPITLEALVNGLHAGVTDAVYRDNPSITGGGYFPPSSTDKINVSNGTVNSDTLKNALSNNTNVTLNLTGDTVSIPATALVDAATKADATLTIVNDNGTFVLPVSVLKLDELAESLGIDVKDLKINVNIQQLSGSAATAVEAGIAMEGASALSAAVDFSITAEGKDGKQIVIDEFDQYVERSLPLSKKPTGNATVALYDLDTNQLSFVPSTFSDNLATFFRTGNSVYVAIENSKSFDDIKGHWGQADIELLAGKLIINGVTDTQYEADRDITRAEFAALVVRSLGLTAVVGSNFSDVKAGEWYAGVVAAAAKAKIVDGYEDGTFRPDAKITREEMAAMIVRALAFAGVEGKVDAAKQTELLSKWADASKIVWGHKEIAIAIDAGLLNGKTDTTLETNSRATRAEVAAMVQRFLKKADFIN